MDRTFLENSVTKFALPKVDVVVESIREHLMQLLNARQGSLRHLINYGLPDLGKIYQELPSSLAVLKKTVIKIIETYEPRLKNSYIELNPHAGDSSTDCVIALTVFAQISNGDWINFELNFLSSGIVFLF